MTRADIRNVAASVLARLLTRAKKRGDDYNVVLTSYVAERFLYRLGSSSLRDRFVLKGAMLLRVWSEHPYRTTRDLDLLRLGDGSADGLDTTFAGGSEMLALLRSFLLPVIDDVRRGIEFDGTWPAGGPWAR